MKMGQAPPLNFRASKSTANNERAISMKDPHNGLESPPDHLAVHLANRLSEVNQTKFVKKVTFGLEGRLGRLLRRRPWKRCFHSNLIG